MSRGERQLKAIQVSSGAQAKMVALTFPVDYNNGDVNGPTILPLSWNH
jgi:hypothetical protein